MGLVSVYGYHRITPMLETRLGLFDTCGVHNLHGIPAIIGGFASAIFVTIDSQATFLTFGKGQQAAQQVFATLAALGVSVASGYVTGWIMSKVVRDSPEEYNDAAWWKAEYLKEVAFFPSDKSGKSHKSIGIAPVQEEPSAITIIIEEDPSAEV